MLSVQKAGVTRPDWWAGVMGGCAYIENRQREIPAHRKLTLNRTICAAEDGGPLHALREWHYQTRRIRNPDDDASDP
jgi:hypothetical protein